MGTKNQRMNTRLIDKMTQKITGRTDNLFRRDLEEHREDLKSRIVQKNVLVIGGAGTIGSAFIREFVSFDPKKLVVIDTNENGLTELVRDLRNSFARLPEIRTYPFSFSEPVFERLLIETGPYEVVANFAALKHVRSEKDMYSIEAMINNNVLRASRLMSVLSRVRPEHFFCVSSDKAANPASIMGASKKMMEMMAFSYAGQFKVTTARFANVAFSNGSLLESYIHRYERGQALVCPQGISRFFVSSAESGILCLLACTLGESGDIFIPDLVPEKHLIPFERTLEIFLQELGLQIFPCSDEEEARDRAAKFRPGTDKAYPVLFTPSDTSGEKPYEEFSDTDDTLIDDVFQNIRIIRNPLKESAIKPLLEELDALLSDQQNKEALVALIKKHMPEFEHIETGKSLDQKM